MTDPTLPPFVWELPWEEKARAMSYALQEECNLAACINTGLLATIEITHLLPDDRIVEVRGSGVDGSLEACNLYDPTCMLMLAARHAGFDVDGLVDDARSLSDSLWQEAVSAVATRVKAMSEVA